VAISVFEAVILVDTIFRPVRLWVDKHSGTGDLSPSYLIQCPWCMSIWLGAAVFGLTYFFSNEEWLWWIWGGFAASYLVGLLAEKVED
jgi:hypothetical protein